MSERARRIEIRDLGTGRRWKNSRFTNSPKIGARKDRTARQSSNIYPPDAASLTALQHDPYEPEEIKPIVGDSIEFFAFGKWQRRKDAGFVRGDPGLSELRTPAQRLECGQPTDHPERLSTLAHTCTRTHTHTPLSLTSRASPNWATNQTAVLR